MGERERTVSSQDMATTSTAVATVPPQLQEESEPRVAVITLRQSCAPPAPRDRKKVVWTEDTVDNEHMNKKKSKCCCIYEKPRRFGESDSEDSEDECEHCFGHVENKHSKHHKHHHTTTPTPDSTILEQESTSTEPTTTVTLRDEPTPAPAPPDEAPEAPENH